MLLLPIALDAKAPMDTHAADADADTPTAATAAATAGVSSRLFIIFRDLRIIGCLDSRAGKRANNAFASTFFAYSTRRGVGAMPGLLQKWLLGLLGWHRPGVSSDGLIEW